MKLRDIVLIVIGAIVVLIIFSATGANLGKKSQEVTFPRSGESPIQIENPLGAPSLGLEEIERKETDIEGKEIPPTETTEAEAPSRLVIKSGNLNLVVNEVSSVARKVIKYAEAKSGWVVSSTITEEQEIPRGSVTIRVPVEEFDETMEYIRGLATKVEYEGSQGEDVTEEYVDLESKLRNLEATEKQFLKIMEKAKTIDEILKVQNEIKKIRGEIEQTKGRMLYLERSAKMAKISVNLALSEELLPVPPTEKWRPGYVAKTAWQDTVRFWRNVSYGVIEFFVKHLLTWIAVLAILALILWKPIKRGWRKLGERKKEVKDYNHPTARKERIEVSSNLALTSLICGILGVVLIFIRPGLGLVLGVAALVLGIKEGRKGYAKSGFILGIIAIVLAILVLMMSSGGDRLMILD